MLVSCINLFMNAGVLRSVRSFLMGDTESELMTTLQVGDKAPYFEGETETGKSVKLTDFLGKKLVLFFYPADNTPTCTAVACHLRDHYAELQAAGYELLGVSPDSSKKHENFIKKFTFPFSLLADPEQKVLQAYGVWGPKKLFGRDYDGVLRTTFVIDERGFILKVLNKVDSQSHAEQILE